MKIIWFSFSPRNLRSSAVTELWFYQKSGKRLSIKTAHISSVFEIYMNKFALKNMKKIEITFSPTQYYCKQSRKYFFSIRLHFCAIFIIRYMYLQIFQVDDFIAFHKKFNFQNFSPIINWRNYFKNVEIRKTISEHNLQHRKINSLNIRLKKILLTI